MASGGDDFPSYLSAQFPHLAQDFRVDFSSGSSRFLAALASSNSIPTPSSSSALSASVRPSFVPPRVPHPPPPASLPPSISLPWVPAGVPAPPYPPVASAPSLAPPSSHSSSSFRFLQPSASAYALGLVSFPGTSAASAVPVAPVVSTPLFHLFALEIPSSIAVSAAPPPSIPSAPLPPFSSAPFAYPSAFSTPVAPSAPFAFGSSEDLLADMPPDVLPRDPDPTVPLAVPDQFRSEFRRMLAFIVDLFPQAAGSAVPPPPRALFKDFFGSFSLPSPPIFLNWFERVRTALADADAHLASFIASSRSDFAFLQPRN